MTLSDCGRILVVDDDPQIRRVLKTILVACGYEVWDARNRDDALEFIHTVRFDLVLLDMDLAGVPGAALCREIRAVSGVSVILIAASSEERDKVEGLQAGADDFVTKPFNSSELLARIHAVLRRSRARSRFMGSRIHLNDLKIDFDTRIVTVCGREEHLTPTEFALLYYLAARANHMVGYQELVRAVWGPGYEGTEQTLRSHIARLRQKIEPAPHEPKYLVTVPWSGYRLQLPK